MIGVDWRTPLDEGWARVGDGVAVQGNLDPHALFAPRERLLARVDDVLRARGRPRRARLQPRPRHPARHAGRERARGGRARARAHRVRVTPRAVPDAPSGRRGRRRHRRPDGRPCPRAAAACRSCCSRRPPAGAASCGPCARTASCSRPGPTRCSTTKPDGDRARAASSASASASCRPTRDAADRLRACAGGACIRCPKAWCSASRRAAGPVLAQRAVLLAGQAAHGAGAARAHAARSGARRVDRALRASPARPRGLGASGRPAARRASTRATPSASRSARRSRGSSSWRRATAAWCAGCARRPARRRRTGARVRLAGGEACPSWWMRWSRACRRTRCARARRCTAIERGRTGGASSRRRRAIAARAVVLALPAPRARPLLRPLTPALAGRAGRDPLRVHRDRAARLSTRSHGRAPARRLRPARPAVRGPARHRLPGSSRPSSPAARPEDPWRSACSWEAPTIPTLRRAGRRVAGGRGRARADAAAGPAGRAAYGRVCRWPAATPQMELGHRERVARIERGAARRCRACYLTGAGLRGTGLPDTIARGDRGPPDARAADVRPAYGRRRRRACGLRRAGAGGAPRRRRRRRREHRRRDLEGDGRRADLASGRPSRPC